MKKAIEYFNKPENMQPGLCDKFVHGAIPCGECGDTWEEFIEFMASYFEEYHEQQSQEEAKERYERATDFVSNEVYMNGEFNRIDTALKLAAGIDDKWDGLEEDLNNDITYPSGD